MRSAKDNGNARSEQSQASNTAMKMKEVDKKEQQELQYRP